MQRLKFIEPSYSCLQLLLCWFGHEAELRFDVITLLLVFEGMPGLQVKINFSGPTDRGG